VILGIAIAGGCMPLTGGTVFAGGTVFGGLFCDGGSAGIPAVPPTLTGGFGGGGGGGGELVVCAQAQVTAIDNANAEAASCIFMARLLIGNFGTHPHGREDASAAIWGHPDCMSGEGGQPAFIAHICASRSRGPCDDFRPVASFAAIFAGAKSIGSSYERRELLVAAVRRVGDAERIAHAYVAAMDGLDSDYERREVLVALARMMPDDASLIARYRDVARRLPDTERGAAERAFDRFAG
jgi:hypothetical protein